MRWLPASGAKVSPVLLPLCMSSAILKLKVSNRKDGSDIEIMSRSGELRMLLSKNSILP
jgi:hypothetical protein